MILIFDLDDTLYDEMTFVEGGLLAVAQYGFETWGWKTNSSYNFLRGTIIEQGRGKVFDRWLERHSAWSKTRVAECVKVYRYHKPNISLYPSANDVLKTYGKTIPLYLVTDGNKLVQRNKISALKLWPIFRKVFITHRYGLSAAKPATYCFEKIRSIENCSWKNLVYVGDDPSKDFVSLNMLNVLTVRVLTGKHSQTIAKCGYDACVRIKDLSNLSEVLENRTTNQFHSSEYCK